MKFIFWTLFLISTLSAITFRNFPHHLEKKITINKVRLEKTGTVIIYSSNYPPLFIDEFNRKYYPVILKADQMELLQRYRLYGVEKRITFTSKKIVQLIIIYKLPLGKEVFPQIRFRGIEKGYGILNISQSKLAILVQLRKPQRILIDQVKWQLELNKIYDFKKTKRDPNIIYERVDYYSDWILVPLLNNKFPS